MGNDEESDGQAAAEDYRRQRQAADANNSGFQSFGRDEYLAWAGDNRTRLEKIARDNGVEDSGVEAAVIQYLQTLKDVEPGGEFDDLNVTLIIKQVVDRIEEILHAGNIPIGDGVVYGVAPAAGLEASQLHVMMTEASIITVTQGFPQFCNLLSKAIALSTPWVDGWSSWAPEKVRRNIQQRAEVRHFWVQIIASFALNGWPTTVQSPALDHPEQWCRLQVLQAIETFAIAHEYGHHILKHGEAAASDATRDRLQDEHEADVFGRMISMKFGMDEEPPNLIAASGAGGVLILGGLELVRRARALLETGGAVPKPRDTHPPFDERVEVLGAADQYAPVSQRPALADLRSGALGILDIVWAAIEDELQAMRRNNIRPQTSVVDVDGWLPARCL